MNNSICNDFTVESAYIITVIDNEISTSLSQRCQKSCEQIKMNWQVWPAFDGTNQTEIIVPDHAKNKDWLNWIKVMDHNLSITEVACALSHISLWAHCCTINKPIVILEHDSVMVKPYLTHPFYNAISYLGCDLQQTGRYAISITPVFGSLNFNYRFMYCAHAYAIDPMIAKNLLAYIIKNGIIESLDVMLRADLFTIIQHDLYAYNISDRKNTTITSRKKTIDGKER